VTATWIKAVERGLFQSWPGLTVHAIKKYLPASEATTKGHLDQTRKNARSTQTQTQETEPTQEPQNEATGLLFATIEMTGRIYTDQTGRFPVKSSRGNQYILNSI
jgi:hypothetical protein